MYEVTVEASFSASHQLRFEDGELEPLHEHNWRVRACFQDAELGPGGILVDFDQVQPALQTVIRQWHNRHLNETPEFTDRNPSAENVARVIFDSLENAGPFGRKLFSVRVWEAPGCSVAYFGRSSAACDT